MQLLLSKYGGKVRGNIRHEMGGVLDASDLDEVLNRAAYLAWRHAGTYSPQRGKLGTWFYVIARNAALALIKSERPRNGRLVEEVDVSTLGTEGVVLGHSQSSLVAAQGGEAGNEASERQQEFVDCLRRCIAELGALQQQIIRADLQSGEVVDAAELARLFGTSTNSIYVSRSAARRRLKRAMQAEGYFGGERETETGEKLA